MRFRLSLLMFLNYAAQGAWCPLLSMRLAKDLGFGPREISWVCCTQALAGLATPLLAGQTADRWFPAQRCLAAFSLVSGLLLWLMPHLDGSPAVFAVALGVWLAMGPANTLSATLCFAHLPDPERDFGRARMWGTVGWVSASWIVGGWLFWSDAASLADIFRVAGILAFALAAYGLTLPNTPPRNTGAGLAPLAALRHLRSRPFVTYWICAFGVMLTFPFSIQLVPLLLAQLGVPNAWVGPTLTVGQSMEIISLGILPIVLTRLGMRGTMLLGIVAWTTLLTVMTMGEPLWLVAVSYSLNGLCISCFVVTGQVFVNSRTRGDLRASAQSLVGFINGLGMLAGNLLVGEVRSYFEQALSPTFAVSAGVSMLLLVIFFVGFREADVTTPVLDSEDDMPQVHTGPVALAANVSPAQGP